MKVKVKVAQSCPTLCDSMDYTVHGILQARSGSLSLLQCIFPGIKPRSPTLQADSLPAEPQGSATRRLTMASDKQFMAMKLKRKGMR